MRKIGLLGTSALCSFAAAGMFIAAPAAAQTAIPSGPATDPCDVESANYNADECSDSEGRSISEARAQGDGIVVVGSRIRRDQFNTADPIGIVTRDEATQAGFTSTAEILQSTAITGGTSQINDAYGGFVVAGGAGANTISLRGLGTTRTLVLLNGRRMAPAGSRGSVGAADLNTLPNAIIDRIETLNTGASSIYGSDAVAGVINIVTRSRVDGITAEATHNITEHGAGNSRRYALIGGFAADRFSVSGSVEYFKRDVLRVGDRSFARCPTARFGTDGTDFGAADFIDPRTGQVRCFPLDNGGVTINTIGIPGQSGNTVVLAPGVPAGYAGVCDRFRPLAGAGGAIPGYECVGGGALSTNIRDTFSPALLQEDLLSPVETYTGFGQVTLDTDVLGNAEFYAEVLLNRRNSTQDGQRQFTLDYVFGSPLIPESLRFPTPFLGASGGNPPIGVRVFADYGLYNNRQTIDFARVIGGVRGDLPMGWRYDGYVGKSWSDGEYTTDLILADRIARSLDVVQNANGTFSCRSPIGGCVAAPALTPAVVGGQFPEAWFNYVTTPVTGITEFRETVANLTVDGPLFRLPGGMVQAAVGVEYRKSSINDVPSEESQNNNLLGFTSAGITRGTDAVREVFGEIEIPVLRDVPFIYDLTLNGSARYTDYDSYGGQETYKVGALYAPFRFLSLRGSYGTSYRAPALFEQFLGGTSGFLNQNTDPCNNLESVTNPLIRERCLSEGLPADFRQVNSVTVRGLGGAEAGLAAETSTALTFGGVLQPTFSPAFGSLSLAVDYFRIKVDNGVAQLSAAQVLSQCYNNPERTTCDTGLITRDPTSRALTVIQSFVNISDAKVEGIDYTFRYSRELGEGRIRFGAQLTQFLERYSRTFPTQEAQNVIGRISNPEWTGTFDVAYSTGPWNVRYGLEWVGATDAQEYAFSVNPAFTPERYDFRTRDYFLSSLSVRYEVEDFGLTLGVRNLTNERPPTITAEYTNLIAGNAPLYSGYDLRGRTFFINTRFGF